MTTTRARHVLLVLEDSEADAQHVERVLASARGDWLVPMQTVHRRTLADGLAWLGNGGTPTAALVDLHLPDASGLAVVEAVLGHDEMLPVVVFTEGDDAALAERALLLGAQDWLVKSPSLDGDLLARTLRHAVTRSRTRRELARSREDLRRFAHTVAHDVKGPMTTTAGLLGLLLRRLREGRDVDDLLSMVERAHEATLRLGELTDGLLAYAEDVTGDEPEPVSMDEVCRWVSGLVAPDLDALGATLEVRGGLPTVRGNRAGLRQVILNLVSNAIKYRSPERALVVTIAGDLRPDEMVEVRVADNGIGIPEDRRDAVFEPGTRAVTGRQQGLGLGLAAVRQVVERHRGGIEVQPGPGGIGTTMVVRLPSHGGD